MDDFYDNFGGGFGGCNAGGFTHDFGFDHAYTHEPIPDFSIDPLAFVPGAVLDCSRASWGISLAVQQSIEMAMSTFTELPPQQQATMYTQFQEHIAANPVPADFYTRDDPYAARKDLTEAQKQFRRDRDAMNCMLTHKRLMALYEKHPVPAQFYASEDVYAHRTDVPEHWKQSQRHIDADRAWDEYQERTKTGRYAEPAVHFEAPSGQVEESQGGQKVFHKKSAEGHVLSNLRISPLDPCESARLLPPHGQKSVLRMTWEYLKGSLK